MVKSIILERNIDILLLQETRRARFADKWSIPGFNTYETRMQTSKDGLMTMVSKKLLSQEINSRSEDMCIVKILLENGKNLYVVNIYIPPDRSSLAALGRLLGSLPDITHYRRDDELIIAGDFNL